MKAEEKWVSINERMPTKVGWYNVKTKVSNEVIPVPFARVSNGKFTWILPDETIITHWQEHIKSEK